jgi:alpha/beta superfamily hydrolase
MIKQAAFIAGPSGSLYTFRCQPENSVTALCVICVPFLEEKLYVAPVMNALQERLANNGFASVRFDYSGDGDSGGSFANASLETWQHDLAAVVENLKSHYPGLPVYGFGLRGGANLLQQFPGLDKYLFWEPVVSGVQFLDDLIKINLTNQMAVYKKVINNKASLLGEMEARGYLNISGYQIPQTLVEDFQHLDFLQTELEIKNVNAKRMLYLLGSKTSAKNKWTAQLATTGVEVQYQEGRPFWYEPRIIDFKTSAIDQFIGALK